MSKRSKSRRPTVLNGKDREAILAGKIKHPTDYETYKREALEVGIKALIRNHGRAEASKLLHNKFGGNDEKTKTYIISEGKEELAKQLRKKGALEKQMERVSRQQIRTKNSRVPQSKFARGIIESIEKRLGIDPNDEFLEVRFLSSVGDKWLDYVGGIDCWIDIFDKKKKKTIASFSIDLTYDSAKEDANAGYQGSKPRRPLNDTVYNYDPHMVRIDNEGYEVIEDELIGDSEFQILMTNTMREFEPIVGEARKKIESTIKSIR